MSLLKKHKLKNLLSVWPDGAVATSTWLEHLGIYRQLRFRYLRSKWIETFGQRAFKKYKDTIKWQGAIFAIQRQLGSFIHPGALTALSLQGITHYLKFKEEVYLFGALKNTLPTWFKYNFKQDVEFYQSNFLPMEMGLIEQQIGALSVKISSPERAILECLYLAPQTLDLVECYHIMEGLTNLRPKILQNLLENCTSIKVSRLFLYMAEKANHRWLKYLDVTKLNLGSGDRKIVENGVYIASYKITIPKELKEL